MKILFVFSFFYRGSMIAASSLLKHIVHQSRFLASLDHAASLDSSSSSENFSSSSTTASKIPLHHHPTMPASSLHYQSRRLWRIAGPSFNCFLIFRDSQSKRRMFFGNKAIIHLEGTCVPCSSTTISERKQSSHSTVSLSKILKRTFSMLLAAFLNMEAWNRPPLNGLVTSYTAV